MADEEVVNVSNVLDVVNIVFANPPRPPHSQQLENEFSTPHDIFKVLGNLLTHGMVFLYGEDVCVTTLTPNQIDTVQQYMHSFGWHVVVKPTSPADHPHALPYMLKLPSSNFDYVNVIFEPYINQ